MEPIEDRLLVLGAATLGESGGLPTHPRLKPAWTCPPIAAQAYTVRCATADNLAIHLAVTLAPKGSVLVVDASDEPQRGYWGEVLTTAAEERSIAGLVIDGCVRDVAALEAHGFRVFSAGVALRGAVKEVGGTVGVPVTVGDVEVSTGDWVVGDRDGITVVPAARLDEIIAAGEARALKESGMFQMLRHGSTTIDLLGLDTSSVGRS